MKKLLTSIVLAGALALGVSGCSKEKEYRVEMENGYVCGADFHEGQDHVWVEKGEKLFGMKIICRGCTGESCMPAVSYAVDPSGTPSEKYALEVVMEDGEFTKDLSWYEDSKSRKENKEMYKLVKKCEDLLEQKYKRGF